MSIPTNFLAFLWHFIKKQWLGFLILICTSSVWALNENFFPYFIKIIINGMHTLKGDPKQLFHLLIKPATGLVCFWLIMEIAMRTQGFTILRLFPRFRANIREAAFSYVTYHSHVYFSNNFAGNIVNKLDNLPTSCERMMQILIFNFISILIAFCISIVLMWQANPIFSAIMLSWFVIHMIITLALAKSCNNLAEIHSESVATLSGKIVDCLTNILTVHLFANNRYEIQYLKNFQNDEIKKSRRASWQMEKMRILQSLGILALICTMTFTLVKEWSEGHINLGDFSLVMMLTFGMLGLIWWMSYQLTIFFNEMGTVKSALRLISTNHEIFDKLNAIELKVPYGEIHFLNVDFYYKKHLYVFKKLNTIIKPGQKIGLVGFSGSGKSTFVNLILRFFEVIDGAILIDQQNIADVTQDSLRRQIAMIPQEPSLFHRSLMENIRYGKLDASDEEVINASKLAHCDEFIAHLEEGYQTLVGERGIKLSGGQRQRIAIARAILKNAPILILDEATSALDSVTEKFIQDSLSNLMHGKTTIVIAHRLSTLADMDRILVFDKGRIIEDGTHEQLLALNGHFAHLWNMQVGGFIPEPEE